MYRINTYIDIKKMFTITTFFVYFLNYALLFASGVV